MFMLIPPFFVLMCFGIAVLVIWNVLASHPFWRAGLILWLLTSVGAWLWMLSWYRMPAWIEWVFHLLDMVPYTFLVAPVLAIPISLAVMTIYRLCYHK
ncbi:hypothetical protein SAMN04515668_4838 [Hymenobacter arizonensis]|uniref:Uncharacterized protein n=1 Tax=Hymenobacter arizonensis TaxID=1227077 RepID=A0A1I6BNV2_HYMAR|nr:hypothetical protein SAMN04515668_4838 [Hymenobacter arizonensis]